MRTAALRNTPGFLRPRIPELHIARVDAKQGRNVAASRILNRLAT